MDLFDQINSSRLIQRSSSEPIRLKLSWEETWQGSDGGLIKNWEVGRALAMLNPELASRAMAGELPPLNWKGGVDRTLVKREKFGSLRYLAQWQGLRGEDLCIAINEEVNIKCAKTQMLVTFTPDIQKVLNDPNASSIEEGALNGGSASGVSEKSIFP
ncbi:hypothetical protein [Pseudomonas helleri]|uniref:Uncharacterized protein n=1 Tax=Pseudomonas helleri TaxID=1608996 RepID=A0A6I1WPF8_9PSED|nr:hypothetical protein [Pseudomonas helleri]MQU43096.1 hypothetical protein [Pseudomonas helleri]